MRPIRLTDQEREICRQTDRGELAASTLRPTEGTTVRLTVTSGTGQLDDGREGVAFEVIQPRRGRR